MVWSGNDGNITRVEIESALGMIAQTAPVHSNGIGNTLSDGPFGQAAYGAGLVYEATGDIRALDLAMMFADNILTLRNDPYNGTVLWTGRRELVGLQFFRLNLVKRALTLTGFFPTGLAEFSTRAVCWRARSQSR